jgi:hypothetical protein
MASVEVTDTYGGEANYAWVLGFKIDNKPSKLALVREAKRLAGWTGLRCKTEDYGDMIRLEPRHHCMVMFITFSY